MYDLDYASIIIFLFTQKYFVEGLASGVSKAKIIYGL
jgi:hypothetical protein